MGFLLAPPKRVHALNPSSGFKQPPFDGSLTVPQIYDWHYHHNPHHPVFVYPNLGGGTSEIPFAELVPAAHRAGRYVVESMGLPIESQSFPLAAIIAHADTITYFTVILGMLRVAVPVFPINPYLPEPAFLHLISTNRPQHIFISDDAILTNLVQKALREMENKDPTYKPKISKFPTFNDLFVKEESPKLLPPRTYDHSYPAMITNSSGSTSLPKPIVWNVRCNLQTAIMPLFGSQDLCEQRIACQMFPMFAGIGLNFISWLSGTGLIMSTFSPKLPTPVLTPDIVFQAMVETNVNYASGSAQFIQAWARDPEKVSFLKGIKGLLYGGTPLNKIVGDYLHKAGVNIQTFYGLTEVGVVGSVLPEQLESEWEYFTINPHCAAEFVPTGDGAYELVVVLKSTHEVTTKSNTTFQGQPAYATGDLLVPHPTRPEYWKLLGRSNDQIILLDGNKANPRHYEDAISHHPEVAGAVVFGQGRPHIGILIEPRKDYTNEGNPHGNSALIDRFWSTIQEVNLQNRAHPQLLREMIVIADKGKPFAYTLKGTPNKRVILQQYAAEIDVLYHIGNNVEG